jgi:hypothetical protein
VDGAVTPENTYYYRIRSVNTYGESEYTAEVSATTPPLPAGNVTVGNTEVFSSVSTSAYRRAMPFAMAEAGEIQSIAIYHNGSSDGSGLILGVYADESGLPGARLGVTSEATIYASEGWQTVNLNESVFVAAGQTIWLAWVFESNPGIRYKSGIPGRAQAIEGWSGGMPANFGTSGQSSTIYSIYCNYIPSAGGAPPVAPSELDITGVAAYEVLLSWVDNSENESGFEIQRSTTPGTGFETIHTTGANVSFYSDGTVFPENNYYYRIRAVNTFGESEFTT